LIKIRENMKSFLILFIFLVTVLSLLTVASLLINKNDSFLKIVDYIQTISYGAGMKLKMTSDLNTVKSIVNDPIQMKKISPWEVGQAVAFTAFRSKYKKNKHNDIQIIMHILESGYAIDPDYLGYLLVFAVQIGNLEMVKAILSNPNAQNIDTSFKIAIYFQAYWGNPEEMPDSFLKKALDDAVDYNHEDIVEKLLLFPVLKKRVSKNDILKALDIATIKKYTHIHYLLSQYLKKII
jgi:hypothetical protein